MIDTFNDGYFSFSFVFAFTSQSNMNFLVNGWDYEVPFDNVIRKPHFVPLTHTHHMQCAVENKCLVK